MLADLQMLHPLSDGLDHARVFRARHKGQRWFDLVLVLHDEQIWKIQAGSFDVDQDLARTGCRSRYFFPGQGVDAGGILTKPGMHGYLR
ncbi:hypothetical protein D3C78_1466670 [compost metagenome]